MNPNRWQRLESVGIAALVVVGALAVGFDWWWLLALFLVFDLAAAGYVFGSRAGAHAYNAVHNYAAPAALLMAFVAFETRWLALVGLAWAFHVAVDRALGYGLKLPDHFGHTHLGWIGKDRGK